MFRPRRSATAAALALAAVATAVLGFAGPASAHVSVNPSEATQGGYGRFAFRVPNERDKATTTKVEVVLPENAPIGSVSVPPLAGWVVTVQKHPVNQPIDVHGKQVTEVVYKVTWTASAGAAIKPGKAQEFPVSMGPLPQVDRIVFKTLQTYSDGNVQRWIEEPTPGGPEPEDPAPVLTLTPGSPSATPATSAAAPTTSAAAPTPSAAAAAGDDDADGAGTALGIAGLVGGLAALLLGGLAFVRTRRKPAPRA